MQPGSERKLIDDCFLHDHDRLRHDEALELLKTRLTTLAGETQCPLIEACGRIVSRDIVAARSVPGHDNSAVDGYALRHRDLGEGGSTFAVTTRIAAGELAPQSIGEGQAARIFTGAIIPQGADTVAMQEDCRAEGEDHVSIPGGLKKGANLRCAGEDLASGERIVERGRRLLPQDVAALASTGIDTLPVFAPLRVGLISSGNELRRPGEEALPGQVYDANRYMLVSLLRPLGVELVDLGAIRDDRRAVRDALAEAAQRCDVVLSTGGASRGEEDHMLGALDELGKRHLWQLAVKPGRPMMMGQIADTLYFGLPGNPVAAFVCFLLYVRPAILHVSGALWQLPRHFEVIAGFEVTGKKPDRREFWRGWLENDADANPVARKFERDGSGLISGLRQATGLIDIGEPVTDVRPGDRVRFIPFSEFGLV
ncbi:MAG: gephyrin-like molybdotransferase Glp [Rhizobiaceae bacterium]